MRLTQIIAAAAIALVSTFVVADDAAEQTIRKSLANLQLDTPIESISASPMAGLYEVKLKGSRVLYASADGQSPPGRESPGARRWPRPVAWRARRCGAWCRGRRRGSRWRYWLS